MSDSHHQFEQLVGSRESLRVMDSLRRGASRRDVLAMLAACGMQATVAGSIAGLAMTAHAQTPKRGGRIRVAGATAAATDTLDPAKQSNQTDYSRGTMLYNGLTVLDASLTPSLRWRSRSPRRTPRPGCSPCARAWCSTTARP